MLERPVIRLAGRWLLPAALLVSGSVAAAAGADVDRRLAECAALSAPSDRLACFESIAADRAAAGSAVAAPQPPARPPAPAPAVEPVPAAPVPAAPVQAAPPPDVAVQAPVADPDASFGAEMLERPKEDPADRGVNQISAEILRVEERTYGERVFHLSNGQVWEELEAGRGRYRSGQSVTVRRAMLGGYMLEADGVRAARVRRIR